MNSVKATPVFVMATTNVIASTVIGVVSLAVGQLLPALLLFWADWEVFALMCFYGASAFCGIFAYMMMVKEAGGVGTTVVSTLRKVLTVALSFVASGRHFTFGYGLGGAMIVVSTSQMSTRSRD